MLRYWEEELQLDVPRNEMGHRYYTDENIKEFLKIKELKEKGYQLKAIRMYLKNEKQREQREKDKEKDRQILAITNARELGLDQSRGQTADTAVVEDSRIKMDQFQEIMTEIVSIALKNNNEALTAEVGDRILKEMNYLMHEQQEQEEERYRKLDAVIREKGSKVKKEKKSLFKTKKERL